jgi:hypothetical protein
MKYLSRDDIAGSIRSVGVFENGSDGGQKLIWDDYTNGENFQADKHGLYALSRADLFNILCLPPDERGGDLPEGVLADALAYCVERRAILIVDPPAAWDSANRITENKNEALTKLGLFGNPARNAAIYFPRVVQPDPKQEGQPDRFVPCGIVAGSCRGPM